LRTSSPSTTSGRDEEIKKKLMAQMKEKERRGEGEKETRSGGGGTRGRATSAY